MSGRDKIFGEKVSKNRRGRKKDFILLQAVMKMWHFHLLRPHRLRHLLLIYQFESLILWAKENNLLL